MQKKAKAPEPVGESAPMWIVSFADLVTLMMSFFVVLYAMKQGGTKQQIQVAAALKATFDPAYDPPVDSNSEFDQAYRHYRGKPGPQTDPTPGQNAKTAKGAKGANPDVETIRPGKDIVTGGKILFDAGDLKLSPESLDVIQQIADHVKGLNNVLMIKGHVSADEIALHPDDPNGFGLSYQRAVLVADALVKDGIDRRVLRPVACGAFEPVKTGVYDPDSLHQNRRVEVFTTDYTASDYFPTQTVSAPGTTAPSTEQP
jgi:chemotaxis protein MotB